MRTKSSALVLAALAAATCFPSGTRWDDSTASTGPAPPPPPVCAVGVKRCALGKIERCDAAPGGAAAWTSVEDCASQGLLCSSAQANFQCVVCLPDQDTCQG